MYDDGILSADQALVLAFIWRLEHNVNNEYADKGCQAIKEQGWF